MKWLVGLDLRPSSQGAMKYGAWLAATSKSRESLVGVHVLEEEHLRMVLRYHHLDEVEQGAQEAAQRMIAEAGVGDVLREYHVVRGLFAEETLIDQGKEHGVDGYIVGRQAKQEGHEVVRLGRVARRLLRSLPGPVIVVPPDLEIADIGDGPVVAVTKMVEDSEGCARFAQDMAERIGRGLTLTHVVPFPEDYGAHYLPPESLEKIRVEHQAEGEQELAEWATRHGFGDTGQVVVQGPVLERVLRQIEELKPAMLVVGSRRLSTLERLLLTSVGSQLAAAAPCAVAVVPPAED